MNTIKLLKSIIMLVELLPYSSTSKTEILEQLNNWLDLEKKYNSIFQRTEQYSLYLEII